MKRQIRLMLAIMLVLMILLAACSPQLKSGDRSGQMTATLTPFKVKATYTSESPQVGLSHSEGSSPGGGTPTLESGEEGQDPGITETTESSATPVATSTQTDQAPQPSATTSAAQSTATSKPTQPPAATSTPKPPADTKTPKPPPADTNTPKPPADTSTPKPPADTNTPKPPADTNTPAPPTPTPECIPSGNSSYEGQVITLINQERAAEGLDPLTANSKLTSAARRHSADMACSDNFSHTGTDGSKPWDRVSDAGYSWSRVTENIAASSYQYFSPASVVNLWMNSSGHKANILDPNVVHIGVGFRFFDNGGYDAYYTANFARP